MIGRRDELCLWSELEYPDNIDGQHVLLALQEITSIRLHPRAKFSSLVPIFLCFPFEHHTAEQSAVKVAQARYTYTWRRIQRAPHAFDATNSSEPEVLPWVRDSLELTPHAIQDVISALNKLRCAAIGLHPSAIRELPSQRHPSAPPDSFSAQNDIPLLKPRNNQTIREYYLSDN